MVLEKYVRPWAESWLGEVQVVREPALNICTSSNNFVCLLYLYPSILPKQSQYYMWSSHVVVSLHLDLLSFSNVTIPLL